MTESHIMRLKMADGSTVIMDRTGIPSSVIRTRMEQGLITMNPTKDDKAIIINWKYVMSVEVD